MDKTAKNIKTWENEEGNLCFSYDMRQPMEKTWVIVVAGVCLVCVELIEYICFKTTYGCIPLLFIFMFIFVYWAFYPCKDNEVIEEMVMNNNIDLLLQNDLREFNKNVHEVRRKFHRDTKGTYGIVTGTYMLVLLSNDEILEYELKYHKATKTKGAYHELLKRPEKCTNPEHQKVIESRSFVKWWRKIQISENRKLSLIIILIVGIGVILASLYFWLIMRFEWRSVIFFTGYVVVFMGANSLMGKSRNKIFKILNVIISLPLGITMLWLNLMLPTMTILMSYIFLGVYAFGIPMLAIKGLVFLLDLNISQPSVFFITLATGSIVCVHGSKFIHWIIKEYTPLKNWGNHKYEAVMTELALYVINKNNVNFLIYLSYFILLTISGFMQIQYNEPLIRADIDGAILKAFLVFIAYSNMISKSKDVEIKTKPLLEKIMRLITTHDR